MQKKKAAFVVAASAASLLALSPLAFAGDLLGDGHGEGPGDGAHHGSHSAIDKSSAGIVSGLNGNNVNLAPQVCNNDVMGAGLGGTVKDVTGSAAGAASLFGDSKAKSHAEDQDNRACGQESDSGDNR